MSAHLLIVDDSPIMRKMICRAIDMAGLDVDTYFEAGNGIEALAVLSRETVAVVLLDINMPVMNGLQFLARIRDDEKLRGVPVVIASTEGSQTRIRELLAAGARGYLRKPFAPEQLREVLSQFLPSRDLAGSAGSESDAF